MLVGNLNCYKYLLVQDSFKKNSKINTVVKLCNTEFHINNEGICGATIKSNCRGKLSDIDLYIIDNFKIDELNKMDEDINYLKELINDRKKELLEPEIVIKLQIERTIEKRRKMLHIIVTQCTKLKDTYDDNIYINKKTLESYDFHNIKSNKNLIQDKIKELEDKYNIYRSAPWEQI